MIESTLSKSSRPALLAAVAVSSVIVASSANADALTWDTDTTDGTGITSGAGTWSWTNGGNTWNNGTTGNQAWSSTNPDSATIHATEDATIDIGIGIVASGLSVDVDSSKTLNFTGRGIDGGGAFIKNGTGTLIFDQASFNNNFSSAQINAGTVVSSSGGTFGSFNDSVSTTDITIASGAGLHVLTSSINFRDLTVEGSGADGLGVIRSTNSGSNSLNARSGGGITLSGDALFSSDGTNSPTLYKAFGSETLNLAGHNLTWSGSSSVDLEITQTAGSIEKVGSGTLSLGNVNNAYSGETRVYGGTLRNAGVTGFASAGFSANSAHIVGNNAGEVATLRVATNDAIGSLAGGTGGVVEFSSTTAKLTTGGLDSSTTYNGTITATGTAGITKVGTGTLTLNGASTTYAGVTTVTDGTLNATNAAAIGSSHLTVNGGTFTTGTDSVTSGAITVSSGELNIGGDTAAMGMEMAADQNFALSGGTISLSFEAGGLSDYVNSTGTSTFSITGGILDLGNDADIDYSATYSVLRNFDTGSVAGLNIINFDSAYNAVFDNAGNLSFEAVPEPSAALLGGLGVLALLRRRRN